MAEYMTRNEIAELVNVGVKTVDQWNIRAHAEREARSQTEYEKPARYSFAPLFPKKTKKGYPKERTVKWLIQTGRLTAQGEPTNANSRINTNTDRIVRGTNKVSTSKVKPRRKT